jgi:hypothetical protein
VSAPPVAGAGAAELEDVVPAVAAGAVLSAGCGGGELVQAESTTAALTAAVKAAVTRRFRIARLISNLPAMLAFLPP